MQIKHDSYPMWALCIAMLFLVVWVIGLLPPILERFSCSGTADSIRSVYRILCHGSADRCPVLFGQPAAVCVRCSGLYLSLILGCALFFPLFRQRLEWKTLVAASLFLTFIMGLQWLLEFTDVIDASPLLQVGTGFMCGTGLSLLLCKSIDMLRGNSIVS